MKILLKTFQRVIVQVSRKEIEVLGFDDVWDNIRKQCPDDTFELNKVENDEYIIFELKIEI